tara:strand:- start:295 stop:597 length:303 start_codon:yes stop_codon:yes gene_type:complete
MNSQVLKGLIMGLLAPVFCLFVFIAFYFEPDGFKGIYEKLADFNKKNVLTHVISLSAIINLILFLMQIRLKKDSIAKGLLSATLIYAFVIIFMKIKIFIS